MTDVGIARGPRKRCIGSVSPDENIVTIFDPLPRSVGGAKPIALTRIPLTVPCKHATTIRVNLAALTPFAGGWRIRFTRGRCGSSHTGPVRF